MQKVHFVVFSVLLVSLFGCTTTLSPTAVLSGESPTPTIQATIASSPVPTVTQVHLTPSLTPEPGLRTDGPHFSYFREVDGIYQFILMDDDGGGRKIILLPAEVASPLRNNDFGFDVRFISPDGKYLAFYTGIAGEIFTTQTEPANYDLALNLLNIETGDVQIITPLLSKDYPNNFVAAAQKMNDEFITSESLQNAFLNGITNALAWSPDGQYLAFAGQMDGLSSDLYIYNVESDSIHRLSSGDQEIQWIEWSPDGNWIMHSSVYWVGQGMSFDIYAVKVDGSSMRYLSTSASYGGIYEWLNPQIYFENESQNGPGDYGLRLVNVDTGKVTDIWDGSFQQYAADLSGRWILLSAFSPDASPYLYALDDYSDFKPGLYLIDLKTMKKTPFSYPPDEIVFNWDIHPIDMTGQIFFLNNPDRLYSMFLSENGEVIPVKIGKAKVYFSTDSKYWIAISNKEVDVFSGVNINLKSIPISFDIESRSIDVAWRPDNSGFFLLLENEIYVVDISNGNIQLVERQLVSSHGPKFLWINTD